MTIEFDLPKTTKNSYKFCNYIVTWLKRELLQCNLEAIELRLALLEHATWIKWIDRTHPIISARRFLRILSECICWTCVRGHFIIYIDNRRLFPGTYNTVEQVMRFINFGNELLPGCYFLSRIMLRYQARIYDYWFAFRIMTQK